MGLEELHFVKFKLNIRVSNVIHVANGHAQEQMKYTKNGHTIDEDEDEDDASHQLLLSIRSMHKLHNNIIIIYMSLVGH